MPGASLWLLPPSSHPLIQKITTLIHKTSTHFSSPHLFIPHVTLTSEIDASTYGTDPQKWLAKLKFPAASQVHVKFQKLQSEAVFTRKLYISVDKPGIKPLGKVSRQVVTGFEDDEKAEDWAENKYNPHLSLLYHDCPQIPQEELNKIEELAKEVGVDIGGSGEFGGWSGGRIVLVPTEKPIKEWEPIAERELQ